MEDTMHTLRASSPSEWSQSAAGDTPLRSMSRIPSANNSARASLEPGSPLQNTLRSLNFEAAEKDHALMATSVPPVSRNIGTPPPQSMMAGESRRQGILGSFSSATSQPLIDTDIRPPPPPPTVTEVVPHVATSSALSSSKAPNARVPATLSKDKRSLSNRQVKRGAARPDSPVISTPPSVDSLILPIQTDDANRILLLMKRLCGRMRGDVEYQSDRNGPWYEGIFYVDEDKGSLMFDSGHSGPFHITLIGDLRGCRVLPCRGPHEDDDSKCLELSSASMDVNIIFRPLSPDDFDLWLASLLCWQQIRPPGARLTREASSRDLERLSERPSERLSEPRKRLSTTATHSHKDHAIIKVGNVLLWDKGAAISPTAIVKRSSTRDLRSGSTSWRRVSCILKDNGELKFMMEHDMTVLSIIDLSQLSRSAVQKLDRSVLEVEFCIAVFPVYSAMSKRLSIFRPVYLALDSRVLFEVWFVLLRAFTVPELYGIEASTNQLTGIPDPNADFDGQVFRIEKAIQVRITGAKIQRASAPPERQLKDRDPLIGHYLAEVVLDGEIRARTTIQTDTKNPFWREAIQLSELPATHPFLSIVLKRIDGDVDNLTHHAAASLGVPKSGNPIEVVCGAVEVPLEKIEKDKDHEQWHPIYDDKLDSVGNILIKLEHNELIVLTTSDYEPLSELLHKFSTGLTTQITSSSPGMLRRLSEVFLNIFQVSGAASEWLMALVEDEMDGVGNQNTLKRYNRRMKSDESTISASDREQIVRDMSKSLTGEANLLFRGNTLLTQALEFHMRRLGKEYLEEILCDKILEINDLNPNCEVDPSRIEKSEEIEQHWKLLIQLTTDLWKIIAATANKLPIELRTILKYVRAVAEDRYGNFLRTVNYTSVSGFLFLRFICPAILNPKLFGLLHENPRPRAQRTLTLIAKGLQALANVSSFGKKESWMEPMNKFLGHERQSFKDYIDQLCSVSPDRNALVLPASYSTPVMIMGRLSPKSREGFPSLPYLIDHQRNYAALVRLWIESHPPSASSLPAFEGDLKEFHNICVDLQRRSDICMAQVDMVRASEIESIVADEALEAFEKSSLIESLTQSYASSAVCMENDPYHPVGSSGSEAEETNRTPHRSMPRDSSPLRQLAEGLDFSNPIGTIRAKAKGSKEARKFLGGLLGGRKGKEESSLAAMRDKGRGKDEKGISRGLLGNLSESWQHNNNSSSDTGTRH
ncbi:hypothetical protein GGR50DRAFT_684921 [Xylaria sp. CBS 124048]|nr:hypothetical protein GGR50DRAFT_684921 [Xylaria sp. CBS 124048]